MERLFQRFHLMHLRYTSCIYVLSFIQAHNPFSQLVQNNLKRTSQPVCRDRRRHCRLLRRCSLHPIKLMTFMHFTDVIQKTKRHKLVIYHPHVDYHPGPGTSPSITICASPLPSHTALSVCQRHLWMKPAYISHSHTQDSHTSQSFMRSSGLSNKSPVFKLTERARERGGLFSVIRFCWGWKWYHVLFRLFSAGQHEAVFFLSCPLVDWSISCGLQL